jgi:O-antigen/teichoic acid export membrane protein
MPEREGQGQPSVLLNAAANVLGQTYSSLVAFVAIPLLIRRIGLEAFGLVGFAFALQAVLKIVDLGLTPTMTREFARLRTSDTNVRDFSKTFEVVYLLGGLCAGGAVMLAAPYFARHWLHVESMEMPAVQMCLILIGANAGIQWVTSFYHGALLGLERQSVYNLVRSAEATIAYGGGVAFVWFGPPRPERFFLWQAGTSLVFLGVFRIVTHRRLPHTTIPPRFRSAEVRRVWRFAAGMSMITMTGGLLGQMDKIILSKVAALSSFGGYSIATIVVGTLSALFVMPIFSAVFPRLSALIAEGRADKAEGLYRLSVQAAAVATIPAAVILAAWAEPIVLLWVRDPAAASQAAVSLPFLAAGVTVNSLMVPAYAMQLAHGWTSIGVKLNIGLLIVFAPVCWFLALKIGPEGAAITYLLFNVAYLLVGMPLTNRRVLAGRRPWLAARDSFMPAVLLGCIAGFLLHLVRARAFSGPVLVAFTSIAWLFLTLATLAACRELWGQVRLRGLRSLV